MKHDAEHRSLPTAAETQGRYVWLPVLAGGLLCMLVALLWWTLDRREHANLQGKIQNEADYHASYVDADLRNRIPSLRRMVHRWEFRGEVPKDEFIHDAQAYLSDSPGLQALEWADKNFSVRWVVPLKGNESDLNLNLADEQNRRSALEEARLTRSPAMTAPVDLAQGGKGLLVFFPIYSHGEFDGFILAVFRIQEWLNFVFTIDRRLHESGDHRIQVFIDDVPVYKQAGWDGLIKAGLDAQSDTKIMGHTLSIHIRPTQAFIEKNKTLLPTLTAGLGFLLSLLVAAVVYLFQKTSMEKLAVQQAQAAIEAEEQNLKAIFESSPVGMLVLDENTNIIMANETAKSISAGNNPNLLQRQPGEVMSCIHSSEDPQGCGHSAHCPLCPLRNGIESVLKRGTSMQNVELPVVVSRQGRQETIWLAVGAEPFIINDRRLVVVSLHDITARKQAEEALKRSEEQVRLLLNSTGEAIYGIDMQGDCTFANPSCLKMLGYASVDQLLGKNMHDLIHHSYPDGSPMRVQNCRIYRAFHEGKPNHVDDEVLWKADGTSFPAEYWSYPQIINGEICGAVVTFVDITERKQIEASLQQRESYLRAIIENQPGLVWLKNTQSQFLAVNQAFALSCGKQRPDDLVGKTDLDIWPQELAEQYRRDDILTMQMGKPTIVEEPIQDKGETRWFETFKTPVFGAQGTIIGTTGYARDITDRKRLEEERRQQFSLINCLLDSIPDIIFFKDTAGVYLGCNPSFSEFVGRSREEIIGRTDYDLFDKEIADFFRDNDKKMLELRQLRHNEETITYPDGRKKLIDTLKTPYWGPDGELIGVVGISRDITAQRQAQMALLESETNFRTFFETMTDMIVVGTPEGRIIFTNKAFERKLGYSSEELAAMHILDMHPADIRKEAEEIFAAMFRGERESCPLPLAAKNGTVIPVETRVWFGRWDGADCIFGISKDLSAEQEAQQRFERLFRFNPTPMALSSVSDNRFLDINGAFERLFGYHRAEIIGKTAAETDLFPDPEKRIALGIRLREEGRIVDQHLQVRRRDGGILDGLFSGEVFTSQGQKYMLTVMVDITELKKAQQALAMERQRLASILEGTNVGTWEWNVQTGQTAFNERWANIIGYTLDEISPVSIDTWVKFVHPDDLKESNELLQRHFSQELAYYESEARMRHKDGSWVWVLDRGKVSTWTEDGKPLLISGTHQDITKRKRAEEQLEQLNRTLQQRVDNAVAELREKDQVLIHQGRLAAMGEMIGNIAHQWRQPLNALSMLITNLHLAHRDHELTETYMSESMATANRLIQKMSTTIHDFRNFFSPDKEKVEFSALHQIRQAVLLVGPAFKNSNIEFTIDETADCTLLGYPNEYSQVLFNLFSNAREAITEKGSLPGLIRISIRCDDKMGVVTVRDNGGGIPEHIRDKIFEPYFTTKSKGTGIGLYMSNMIIERNMHGLIEARNVEGGSEFSISIPLAEKTAET